MKGRYVLGKKLATGGMAEVFQARVHGPGGFEKDVVVKRILPLFADDGGFRERFFQEARLAALLNHPHIVQVYELVEQEGDTLLAMEAVHGADLATLLRALRQHKRRLPITCALHIAAGIADALGYAHGKLGFDGKPLNLVHRDVTPSNVLLSFEGVPKLIDFGIAKAASSSARTQTGQVLGKPWYLSPEQCYGNPLDGKSDVFSLGVVMFQSLAGRVPFGGKSDIAAMEKIAGGIRPKISQLVPGTAGVVEDVIDAALTTDKDKRPSARELKAKIERALSQVDPERRARDELAQLLGELFYTSAAAAAAAAAAGGGAPASPQLPGKRSKRDGDGAELLASAAPLPVDVGAAGGADPFAPAPTLLLMDAAQEHTLDDDEIGTVDPPLDATVQVRALSLDKPKLLVAAAAGAAVVVALVIVAVVVALGEPEKPPPLGRIEDRLPPPQPPPLDEPPPGGTRDPEPAAPPSGVKRKPKATAPATRKSEPNATSPATVAPPKGAKAPDGAGFLTIRSEPWAQVWWGAKSLGITQLSNVEMPAGTHNLFFKNPISGHAKTVTVTIKKGERKSVYVELDPPKK